jgi:hypothetical protein
MREAFAREDARKRHEGRGAARPDPRERSDQ